MARIKHITALCMALILLLAVPLAAEMEHPHVFPAEWTVYSYPTCTETGYRTKSCTVDGCSVTMSEVMPKLGHDFKPWTPYSAPTCTNQGMEIRECNRCGITESRYIKELGHQWGGWFVDYLPSCLSTGQEKRECSRCGAMEYRTIKAMGHDLGAWSVFQHPNCTQMGLERRECSRCDFLESRYLKALGHDFDVWTEVAATCTTSGERTRTCKRCGAVERHILYPLGHQFGAWVEVLAPTCTTQGKSQRTCGRCGQVETGVLYALKHAMQPFVVTLAPTCTAEGERVSTCARGDHQIKEKIKKLPHKFGKWYTVTPSTCLVKGVQERQCSVCGTKEQGSLKLAKHTPDTTWLALRKPTLERVGVKIKRCTVCNREVQRREYAPDSFRYEVPANGFGVPVASVLPELSGWNDRLIPLTLIEGQEQRFPIVTLDGHLVGLIKARYEGGMLTVNYEMNDPATLVLNESLLVFNDRTEISAQSLSPVAPGHWFGGALPIPEIERPVIVVRLVLSYDQKAKGNSLFSEQGMYLDGITPVGAVLQDMMGRIMGQGD